MIDAAQIANEGRRGARVEVRGVTKTFVSPGTEEHQGRRLDILRGIDLVLEPGEMVAVVGASGAGKSTLLHCIGTLDLPSGGQILFDGKDVTRLAPSELAAFRNRSIGFVFQFHHLLPEFTALENVMMPALIQRIPRPEAERMARHILTTVRLGQRLQHRPGELSGGEQQRVALARAMILRPALILADEPTGNLDTRTGEEIHELFFELNRERGTTMLIVTHNPELARRMPRRVTMVDGRLADAPPAEQVSP